MFRPFALLSICCLLLMTKQFGACEEASSAALALDQDDGGPVVSPQEADQAASVHLKQSGLLPAFLWPMRAREKPNVFLIGLKPYYNMLPKPMQEMIDQQIRPQTDELSAQILSSLPGADQMYQQMSDFLDIFSNFLGGSGGDGNGGGSSSLSNLMSGFGRRR